MNELLQMNNELLEINGKYTDFLQRQNLLSSEVVIFRINQSETFLNEIDHCTFFSG